MQDALFDVELPETNSSVYVIGARNSSVVKIGRAIDVPKRLMEIQIGNPERLVVHWHTPGGCGLERWLHGEFRPFHKLGEWFDFKELNPINEITGAVERLNADPQYEPNEFGCRRLRPTEHDWDLEPGCHIVRCTGRCGSTAWPCWE